MTGYLKFENLAVRVLYFFNVIDSFLPFSVIIYLMVIRSDGMSTNVDIPGLYSWPLILLCFLIIYSCFKIAEFHVFYFICAPLFLVYLVKVTHVTINSLAFVSGFFLVFTFVIQFIFMAIPNAVAARSPFVPVRVLLNSLIIFAPTTFSIPVTLGYQLMAVFSIEAMLARPFPIHLMVLTAYFLIAAIITRKLIKRGFIPPKYQPQPPKAAYKRVILLNIDGVSYHAFKKSESNFLNQLESNFSHAAGGAFTVYKAFTNPAFASILSGTPPSKHKVMDNNFGQSIKTQALPDIIKSRLYGSMHVKHFSRSEWDVTLVSPVSHGYDRADAALFQKLKEDLTASEDTKLWIVDMSMTDFCGHAWGGYSRQYYDAIRSMGDIIRDFFGWLSKNDLLDDTLFIISSDHGLFVGEHAYILSEKEERVPLIFVGKDIKPSCLEPKVSIIDIAANISYFLGKPYCKNSTGRVFQSINNYDGAESLSQRLGLKPDNSGQ